MRLSTEAVLSAIEHPNGDVRALAVGYFTCAFSQDPRVMPAVIRSIEKYGWDSLEEHIRSTSNLTQTEETVRWLLDQYSASVGNELRQSDLACVLIHVSGTELRKFEREITDSREFDVELADGLLDSIRLAQLPPEELWKQLVAECGPLLAETAVPAKAEPAIATDSPESEADSDKPLDEEDLDDALDELEEDIEDEILDSPDHDHLNRVAKALATFPEFVEGRVRDVLRATAAPDSTSWEMPEYAARVAREARITSVIPELFSLLETDSEYLAEEVQDALSAIGSDTTIDLLREKWLNSRIDFRLATLCIIEATHTDHSVEVTLVLAEQEDDPFVQASMLTLALRHFDTRAIDPFRRHVLTTPMSLKPGSRRHLLLTVCELMNETFPEQIAWQQLVEGTRAKAAKLEADQIEAALKLRPAPVVKASQPVRSGEQKVGRNDPCPCGSGKKFKKCCGVKK